MATSASRFLIRPGESRSVCAFGFAARIEAEPDEGREALLRRAVGVALPWFREKMGGELPGEAGALRNFEIDLRGHQQLQAVAIPEEGCWSIRLVQPDAPFPGHQPVPGRSWTTELALRASGEEGGVLALRVWCNSTEYADAPFKLTRPAVVPDLIRGLRLHESLPLGMAPWLPGDEAGLEPLRAALADPARHMPLVVAGLPLAGGPDAMDLAGLARRCAGFAHVAGLDGEALRGWNEGLPRGWGLTPGALRWYRPGCDPDEQHPDTHPLTPAHRIERWTYGEHDEGREAFLRWLLEGLRRHAASKKMRWGDCLYHAEARAFQTRLRRRRIRAELEQELDAVRSEALDRGLEELEQEYETEIQSLRERVEEAEAEAAEYEKLAGDYREEADGARREASHLRAQSDQLRLALQAAGQETPDVRIEPPDDYADLPQWIERHFSGRLLLHPRAVKALKKAVYENLDQVAQALKLLATTYREMRLGLGEGLESAWKEGLAALHLEKSKSISEVGAGQEGEDYRVPWPPGSQSLQPLEDHLKAGNSRDPRHCLRIYYFWDSKEQQVVVGWLPSHLGTRGS